MKSHFWNKITLHSSDDISKFGSLMSIHFQKTRVKPGVRGGKLGVKKGHKKNIGGGRKKHRKVRANNDPGANVRATIVQ